MFNPANAFEVAQEEVRQERFRAAVDVEKIRIRAYRPWWHKFFPFVITITRRS